MSTRLRRGHSEHAKGILVLESDRELEIISSSSGEQIQQVSQSREALAVT